MSDGRLLVDVADAITSNQEVDWNRARGASRPGHGRALDNLRVLSEVFATHRRQGAVSASLSLVSVTARRSRASRLDRSLLCLRSWWRQRW